MMVRWMRIVKSIKLISDDDELDTSKRVRLMNGDK